MTKKELIETRTNLLMQYDTITKEYKDKFTELANNLFGEEYSCINLSQSTLNFGFYYGTWNKTGDPMSHTVNMYIGEENHVWNETTNSYELAWRFEMNVSAMGSFNITGEKNRELLYYTLVSKIIQNGITVESLAKEYYNAIKEVRSNIDKVNNDIRKIERDEEYAINKQKFLEKYSESKEFFETTDKERYVIINYNDYSNSAFTYRNNPVNVLPVSFEGDEQYTKFPYYVHDNFSWNDAKKLKIVQLKKIKLIKFEDSKYAA